MDNAITSALPSNRLGDIAYARILEALFSRKVLFGSFISQSELAKMTGLGVGPVRDALKLLEADGVLFIHPRSGIEVVRPSTELARSTYQFRTIIERFAVRQFTRTASLKALDDVIDLHERARDDVAKLASGHNFVDEMAEVEDGFHLPICAALSNAIVDSAYGRLQLLSKIVKMNGLVTGRTAEISINEHLEVLLACKDRDPDRAEEAIVRHLNNALQRNLGLV